MGLGLVITSLAFLLQPTPEITEEEIIQRARELDMVFKEEVVVFEEEALEEGISEEELSEEELSEEDSSEVAKTDEVQEDRESVQNDEDNDEKDFAEDEEDEEEKEELVEVTIPSGYYLTKIASLLEEEGVLADKESFIQLTREMDVSHKLRRGIYQLPREGEPLEVLNILMEGGDSID